ncbi:hypothetical protein CPB83DRAFT_855419 [Crepidotus variabilis]|uniref:NAD-dependent epimerase/dehydratase domain-containing protein n=1 Tax=Crepidotus variabilis TaxID=179855 RepID=A0A9P6EF27_9AGAR|nr:hypothetical protein CPB83DRAFT_855419 [Crepidotus variabilis]
MAFAMLSFTSRFAVSSTPKTWCIRPSTSSERPRRVFLSRNMAILSSPQPGSTPPKVLVTGANGYIAMWIVRLLLEKGYAVRGAVRSEEKVAALTDAFGKVHSEWSDRLEWAVVPDITKDGAFDESVKGVEAIVHTAAPLDTTTDDPDEYIKPSVNGTLSLLTSALKHGSGVKRVAITSSCTAAVTFKTPQAEPGPLPFRETGWAEEAIETVKKDGAKTPDSIKYRAAKTLAERAAFDFVEKNKDKLSWDISTLLPSVVIGPNLGAPKSPEVLNASLNRFYRSLFTNEPEEFLKSTICSVDVRDVAQAHLSSLVKEAAGGQRFLVSGHATTWQRIRDVAYDINHVWYSDEILPRGNPDLPRDIVYFFDNNKSRDVLGIEYESLEKTVGDTMADFEGRGWVEKKVSL